MADNFGLKIGIEGEKEFKKALSDINASFKVLGSEMKLVESEFGKNDKSVQSLTSRNEVLSKEIDAQKQKIETLRSALDNAASSFGENDRRTQNWQIQLNNAEASLNDMKRELKDNEEALKNTGNAAELSGSKFEGLGSVLKGVGVAMGAVVTAAAACAAALGKEVITAYADYEQLVGGIDTLFKNSSGEMQKYAANAYKTAGLSANDYMETVTSFSASLVASLGGDTEKAVKYADMAITDMSDNANKMGSDISSIQTAYQGFAKQNYTMLDNLKLGYGGTKEEMQRLLSDAEAISGIHYDISSYADVVEAIHVIQEEMDIAGTTAKEADATISGSISSLQAAWKNLIVGFGDANADLEMLCNNVAEAFQTVVENITPVIENIVSSLPTAMDALLGAFSGLLPMLLATVTDLFTQVLSALVAFLPHLIPVAVDAVLTIVNAVIENLPMVIEAAVQLITTLITGLTEAIPQLIPVALEAVITIVNGLIDSLPMVLEAALQMILALTQGLLDSLPQLIARLPEIIMAITDFLIGSIPQIIEAGIQLFISLVAALPEIIAAIIQAIPQIITAIVSAFESYLSTMAEAGLNLIKGLWQGISDAAEWLWDKISGFFGGVVARIKDFFGIHSPSTVFAEMGGYMAEGLGEGFSDEMGSVSDQMTDASSAAGDVTGQIAIEAIKNGIANNIALLEEPILQMVSYIGELFAASYPEFIVFATTMNQTLADGLSGSKNLVLTEMNKLIADIGSIFTREMNGFINIGRMIMEGIGQGVTSRSSWLNSLVTSYVAAIKRSVESMLGIHSPSKVFAEIGGYMAEGMGVGFEKEMSSVRKQMEDSIPTSFNSSIDNTTTADIVNGIVGGLSSVVAGGGSQTIVLQVKLDSKTIAQTIFDPLRDVSRQRGVAFG